MQKILFLHSPFSKVFHKDNYSFYFIILHRNLWILLQKETFLMLRHFIGVKSLFQDSYYIKYLYLIVAKVVFHFIHEVTSALFKKSIALFDDKLNET